MILKKNKKSVRMLFQFTLGDQKSNRENKNLFCVNKGTWHLNTVFINID